MRKHKRINKNIRYVKLQGKIYKINTNLSGVELEVIPNKQQLYNGPTLGNIEEKVRIVASKKINKDLYYI